MFFDKLINLWGGPPSGLDRRHKMKAFNERQIRILLHGLYMQRSEQCQLIVDSHGTKNCDMVRELSYGRINELEELIEELLDLVGEEG